MMMMDDENRKSLLKKTQKLKKSKNRPGAYGEPPGGNEWPSKNSIAPKFNVFFFENRTFKNRSESLQNHPNNVFRAVENRDIKK